VGPTQRHSHTARLLAAGPGAGPPRNSEREAVEAVIAATSGDRDGLVSESADALYHLVVMLAASGASIEDALAELERREGVSGVAEKAARRR
jgi:phosphoribosyl-ATP pyrophosphohydrolase